MDSYITLNDLCRRTIGDNKFTIIIHSEDALRYPQFNTKIQFVKNLDKVIEELTVAIKEIINQYQIRVDSNHNFVEQDGECIGFWEYYEPIGEIFSYCSDYQNANYSIELIGANEEDFNKIISEIKKSI